jgi:hypothetical protein
VVSSKGVGRAETPKGSERRKHRRAQARVSCRPVGIDPLASDSTALDVSLGGLRVYSDYALTLGLTLNVELHTEGCPRVCCTVEVVRVVPLGRGAPAPYEVGLRFVRFDPIGVKVLLHVLGRDSGWRP